MTEAELRLQNMLFYIVSNLSIKGVVVVVVGVVELPEDFESVLSILCNNKENKPIGLQISCNFFISMIFVNICNERIFLQSNRKQIHLLRLLLFQWTM